MKTKKDFRTLLPNQSKSKNLSDEEFNLAVKLLPWEAMEFKWNCDRLSYDMLIECAKKEPWAAMQYNWACDRLKQQDFDFLANLAQVDALSNIHSFNRLSGSQLAKFVSTHYILALDLKHICDALTDKQFDSCISKIQKSFFLPNQPHVFNRLTDEQWKILASNSLVDGEMHRPSSASPVSEEFKPKF